MFSYPDTLPIISHKAEITKAIIENQVTIIAGDTGSGKTTQLPRFCLEAFSNLSDGLIGCTQPRRVAAVTVSERVAEELGSESHLVGYKIRFQDKTSPQTRIKFMTDGILLAETQQDRFLKKYQTIILDEAHERSLNIDFLLGYFKSILAKRPELKLIITSATIDTLSFAKHFPLSKVITVHGRSYPVEVRHRPFDEDLNYEKSGYIEHAVEAVEDIAMNEPPGDILIFLPTEKDIRECCDQLNGRAFDAEILPMFGRLIPADQRKIFRSYNKTKIVVATNVAETSITVPGIRYVIDTGLARISSYNSRAKTTSLPVSKISQASCDQRKGRCGRVAPGVCIRLFSEDDYLNRSEYTLPEIRRSNLAEVILRMIALKLGDPRQFPFVDPPHSSAIRDGYKQLLELGAISSKGHLTAHGKIMAQLPIDPRISRIIIESKDNKCLKEISIIASALAIQDPRVRPADKEQEAEAAHSIFSHPHSDFLVLLKIWNLFHDVKDQVKSWSRLKKFCKKHYLSFQRMREWIDLHDQMRRILKQYHFGEYNKLDAPYAEIHKSLAIGFLRNIARKKEKKLYMTTTGKEVMVFPGSHQFQTSGQWILAASMLETNRLYALTVATIEPEWLEKIGGNLCKYSWDNPRWSENRGHVLADEKVTLFGLVLVSGRQVNFGQRDTRNRQDARNIFIQKALIEGKLKGNYSFLQHNLQLVKKWEETEQRLRKRNILTDDSTLFSFYNDRLDLVIYDRNTLNRYLKKTKKHPHLFLKEKDILHRAVESCELMDFPISLRIGSHIFQLHYSFDPGKDHDGITIRIPINLVEIVPDNYCEWLVPGLLKEKTTFLLKGLPKKLRKHIIPINQAVDKVLDDIDAYKGDYYLALERSLLKQFKIDIPHSAWSSELPPHLKMHYALIDDNDQIIGSGYILREVMDALQKKVGNSKQSTAKPSSEDEKFISTWNGVLVKDWSFTDFPKDIPLYSPQGTITGFLFPVISPSPNKGGVRVSFESDRQQAEKMNIKGMTCLYRMQFSSQFKSLKKYCTTSLSGPSFFWLIEACSGKQKAVEKILQCVFKLILNDFPACIHQNDIYEKNVRELQQAGLYSQGRIICDKILFIIRKRQDVSKLISHYSNLSKKTHSYSAKQFNEYQETLEEIVAKNYLEVFSLNDFEDCDRYLKSLSIRIERGYADSKKDAKKSERLRPYLHNLQTIEKKQSALSQEAMQELSHYKKMVQEFRVSLFSPEIKTRIVVSEKKLKLQWKKIS